MNINLTKHIFGDFDIPSSQLIGNNGPGPIEGVGLSDNDIKKIISNPIGTQPLYQMAKGHKKALLITDDISRETPLSRLLPPALDELIAGGIKKDDVTILIGLGTHRPMTAEEINDKFGAGIAKEYKIVNHEWDVSDSLISLGSCELDFEVIVNKLVQQHDFIISFGSIVPHATAGFSGGGKTVMPGICGEKTIEDTHWAALNYSMSEILGNSNNSVRKVINQIARKVNLRMIVNTILSKDCEIYGMVAGDLEFAFEEGVKLCKQVYGVSIPQKADIVIAEAYPADVNLRQAIKAICAADLICNDEGIIILVAECPEGIAKQFPEFEMHGFKNPELLYKQVEDGVFNQKLMAYTLVAIGRIISKRVKAILVSPNISLKQSEDMGFLWAPDMQQALEKAYSLTNNKASVICLKQASTLFPILESNIN